MREDDVARAVRQVAFDLRREGNAGTKEFIANPSAVHREVRLREPAVWAHILRHYGRHGSPYQTLNRWIPEP